MFPWVLEVWWLCATLHWTRPQGLFPGAGVQEPCSRSLFAWCQQKVSLSRQSGLCSQNCSFKYFLLHPAEAMLGICFFKWKFFLLPPPPSPPLFLSCCSCFSGVFFIPKFPSTLYWFCSAFVVYDGSFICFSKFLCGALVSCITGAFNF